MYSKYNWIFATLTLLVLFNFTACSDDNSTGNEGEGSDSYATINGSVEDEFAKSSTETKAKDLESTVVTAARITSTGSFETIEGTETDVNASGEFNLEVDASVAEEIVIVAENEGNRLKGYVVAELENGRSYAIKPIDTEYSAETDVYTAIVADGSMDRVHKSDIETIITSDIAAEIYGNASSTNEFATAVMNSADARAEYFSEFSDNAESDLEAYFETMTEAQVEYESTLNLGSSAGEAEAAFEAYLETKVNAYSETTLEEKETAEFLHMQGRVILNSMNSASSDVKNDVRHSSSYMIAIATDNAVRARAEASNMSDATVSTIVNLGSALRTDVQSSGGSETSVEAAFETYHDEVRTAIENDSSVEGSVVVTIDTEINAVSGAKFTFHSALEGLVDATQFTDLYVNFSNNVDAIVDTNSALIGDMDAQILSDIMVLINLSS